MASMRLLDRVSNAIRVRQYSMATEKAYVGWIRRFILFHRKRDPGEMGKTGGRSIPDTSGCEPFGISINTEPSPSGYFVFVSAGAGSRASVVG